MKPNFALRLAHDSIELLQRSPDGWLSVGSARLDSSDLDEALSRLRDHAQRLAPDGIATKLIIPDTELRYEAVLAPGPDDDSRRRQIEAAIDGLTPYSLDELIYDWVVDGDQAHVVIVARETLSEAEEFAIGHGLNPVSCVALPAAGQFLGEPFFGATRHAAKVLPDRARVLPDLEPVQVVGRARIPAAQTMPPAGGTPAPATSTEQTPEAPPAVGKTPPKSPLAEAAAPSTPEPRPVPTTSTPTKSTSVPDPRKRLLASGAGGGPPAKPTAAAARKGLLPAGLRRAGDPSAATAAAGAAAGASISDLVRRFGARLRKTPPPSRPADTTAMPDTAPKDAAAKSDIAAPTFASRRNAKGVADTPPQTPDKGPGGRLAAPDRAEPGIQGKGTIARLGEAVRTRLRPAAETNAAVAKSRAKSPQPAGVVERAVSPAREKAAPLAATDAKTKAAFERVGNKPTPAEPIVAKSRPPASEAEKAREAEALTIFGARSGGAGSSDFARRGVALTGGLVLLLIAFGVWFAYFSTSPETQIATPESAPESAEPPATASLPADPVTAPPAVDEAETAAPPSEEDTAALPDETVGPDARLEALVEEALRQAEPTEQFADPDVAGVATTEETAAGTPSEAASAPLERLALPGPLQRPQIDLPTLVSLPPPPPFGTEMELGADGLVVATPDGAMTPDGVTVFARRPAEAPPARPELTPPAPEATPEADAPIEEDASAADVIEPPSTEQASLPAFTLELETAPGEDPALAAFRPQARPQSANAPEAEPAVDEPEAATEIVSLEAAPPGAIAVAALRPNPRPESLIERAAATTESAPEPEAEVDLSSATPQAVARSLQPNARPQDFSATVQRALAAAARSQAPATQQAAQQSQQQQVQPQAPQPQQQQQQAAAPAQLQIPTSASVAETATERRAINLRRVNLIGVFGTQTNRRALVRLSNGQVVRVQVGDALDGGRVSAIGDTELRYVRSGRNQVLRIGQSG